MKKIIAILLASSFLVCNAYAGGMIGFKLGTGELDGKRTSDPSHGTATKASGSVDSAYAAVFAEVGLNDALSFGVEYVPLEAIIDTEAATTTDSHVTISDFTTVYALFNVPNSPFYGKIGYGHADLAVQANYTTVTVNSHSDALEGMMLGVGASFDSALPFMDVLRVEGNYYEFDEIAIKTTNTNGTAQTTEKKGEADLMTLSVSIAKSF